METIYDEEIWKPIKGFERFEISNLGRARSLGKTKLLENGTIQHWPAKMLTPTLLDSTRKIPLCTLRINNKAKRVPIWTLVVNTFLNVYPKVILYKDGNCLNNCLSNLDITEKKICNCCKKEFAPLRHNTKLTSGNCPKCVVTILNEKDKLINRGKNSRGNKWVKNNPEKAHITALKYSRKKRMELRDSYIKNNLITNYGVTKEEITPELIETNRTIIKLKRLCKQLNN